MIVHSWAAFVLVLALQDAAPNAARPLGAEAAGRRSAIDSQTLAGRSASRDSSLAARRRLVDSIRTADSVAAARSRGFTWLNDGPFAEFTLPFYGTVLCGIAMAMIGFLLRHRDQPRAAKVLWAVAGVVVGSMIGAVAFVAVFMFFGILSVGFSEPSPALVFGMSLFATAFGIAWVMSLRYRRLR